MNLVIDNYQDYIEYIKVKNPLSPTIVAWNKKVKIAKDAADWYLKNVIGASVSWEGKDEDNMTDLDFVNWYNKYVF